MTSLVAVRLYSRHLEMTSGLHFNRFAYDIQVSKIKAILTELSLMIDESIKNKQLRPIFAV